ncbi:MAG: radical SAM family heme chaperone HemW, partial [Stellaceae bacterium]
DYLGIGPGAHGRLRLGDVKYATANQRAPETWLAAVERDGHGTATRTALAPQERRDEMAMMGLRLTSGLTRGDVRDETGGGIEDAFDRARLDALIAGGFLDLDQAGLRATAAGRQRLNAVLDRLLN